MNAQADAQMLAAAVNETGATGAAVDPPAHALDPAHLVRLLHLASTMLPVSST